MRRKRTGKRIQLTSRDLEILSLLHRYRFLRSTHLHSLAGGKSKKRFVERLGDLYHECGYIDRPEQQWMCVNARYMPVVYALSAAGQEVLARYGAPVDRGMPAWKRARPGRHFQHELMVCEILASIEIGARAQPGLRFISWSEILASAKMPTSTLNAKRPLSIRWQVSYRTGGARRPQQTDCALIPDALFGLEYATPSGKKYRFFALEADRNTQPVVRKSLRQSSYLRKILQYQEMVTRSGYRTRWGLPNLLVLNVTTGDRHRENIMRLLEDVSKRKGSRFFLFRTMPSLMALDSAPLPEPDLLTGPWHRAGHPDFFIDRP